ncbi:MAG: flagellar filament capping protein FliD [Lachnospiraceae bacterium]|nr:flagellar filament capping protein FliD [Lachnospiraceae bacterium]
MTAINSIYDYYLTTYGMNRTSTRYDAHKKSELRNIYNSMVKLNKDAPLYKLKNTREVAKFAIDIKEGAQNIRNVVASISGSEDIMTSLQKKSAASSQPDIVDARYIGIDGEDERVSDLQIEVRSLAKPQINIGNFLRSNQQSLPADSYAFDLATASASYEFQFTVNDGDSNYTVQSRLANLISNAGIGLSASVIEDPSGRSALRIESLSTGRHSGQDYLFRFGAAGSANSAEALETLGIAQISQESENSSFLLNGAPYSSYSNTFSINNVFELELKGVSPEDTPATIGFKTNTQAVMENIQTLADAYNSVLDITTRHSASRYLSSKLQHQIGGVAMHYQQELEDIGLSVDEDNYLSIREDTLTSTIEADNASERLFVLNNFKRSLDAKASIAVLNPLDYVNKVVVAYKNPGRNFVAPYASSIYSGLMLDRYC